MAGERNARPTEVAEEQTVTTLWLAAYSRSLGKALHSDPEQTLSFPPSKCSSS